MNKFLKPMGLMLLCMACNPETELPTISSQQPCVVHVFDTLSRSAIPACQLFSKAHGNLQFIGKSDSSGKISFENPGIDFSLLYPTHNDYSWKEDFKKCGDTLWLKPYVPVK